MMRWMDAPEKKGSSGEEQATGDLYYIILHYITSYITEGYSYSGVQADISHCPEYNWRDFISLLPKSI